MPRLEYPAYFENNLIGFKAKEDILHREVIMYVPYSVGMTVDQALNHPVLGIIYKENEELLGSDNKHSNLTLSILLMYERLKGKESYWYTYLQHLPAQNGLSR